MNEISDNIKRLKRLLNKYIDTQFLSIDDQESLLQVCLACSDTNDFIKYAETESQNNVDGFPIIISSLKTDVDEMIELLNTHESGFFSGFDTKSLCVRSLKPFYERWDSQKEKTLTLWRDYCETSNRLDYFPIDSLEYQSLSKLCEDKKRTHDDNQKITDTLYAEYKLEESKVNHSIYFDIVFVDMLLSRLSDIMEVIITGFDSHSNTKN